MDDYAPNLNLNDAIASIYEASLDSAQWPKVLEEFSQLAGVASASLIFLDDNLQVRRIFINATHSAHRVDLLQLSELTAKKLHETISSQALGKWIKADNLSSLPFIEQLSEHSNSTGSLVPANNTSINKSSINSLIPLMLGDSICAALLIHSPANAELNIASQEVIEQLAPHFVRALHIHNHLSALKHRNDSMLEALQRTNIPVFILNADLQTIFISREAELLLQRHPAVSVNAKGQLHVFFAEEQNQLTRLLNDFLIQGFHAQYMADKGIGLAIRHPDRLHPLRLCFLPVQKPDFNQPHLPFIAIFAYDPEQPRHVAPEYLKQAFHLTAAEIHVAQLLVSGYNVAEIAEVRGTTLESTRWQMKQVLQKTNTHSQAELVRMLIMLGNDFNADTQLLVAPPKNTNSF